ncbi:MAG: hypothetical protein K2X99_01375 [Gemmatimonadaceae bacterium]|nr:hypothetical protein [Gemmatimonadaceae bacterium]
MVGAAMMAYGAVANDSGTGFRVRVTPERVVAVNAIAWTLGPRPGPSAQPTPLSAIPSSLASFVTTPLAEDVSPGEGNAAVTDLGPIQIGAEAVSYIAVGPNSGIAYLRLEPTLPASVWWRNRDIEPGGAWHSDQNGGIDPTYGTARCTAAVLPGFLREVERHEGVGLAPDSHQGIFARADEIVGSWIEELLSLGTTPASAARSLGRRSSSTYRRHMFLLTSAAHTAIEREEEIRLYTPAPTGLFPCRWDFLARDP